jgi:hypothetical protein
LASPANNVRAQPCYPGSPSRSLEQAILKAVAYADVFDYPLTVHEVHRYLAEVPAPLSAVSDALENGLLSRCQLACHRGYVTLPGRASIVETRLRRQAVGTRLWPIGIRYGLVIGSLPFVRMVAITGTLAVDNVDHGADIDYLIVTAPRRVWLARLIALIVVHLARLEQVTICPNYVISADAMEQWDHTLFTAHELAQMVPLYGLDVYRELMGVNDWAQRLLPNAFASPPAAPHRSIGPLRRALKWGGERALGGKLGDALERWEMQRKVSRLSAQAADGETCAALFSPQCCKGHLEDHGSQIREAYAQRLCQVGLEETHAAIPSPSDQGPALGDGHSEDGTDAY